MALFPGEDLVDVPMPGGQVLKLPRSIVPSSALPQQQIGQQPPGFTDETVYNVNEPFASSSSGIDLNTDANGVVQPPVLAPAGPPQQRELPPVTIDTAAIAKQQAAQAKKDAAAAQAQAAYAASPQGRMAATTQGIQQAGAAQEKAITDQAVAEGAQQKAVGEIQAARNTQIDQIFQKQAADAQQQAIDEDKKRAEVTALRDKIANTKIDRSVDHPILAAIGVALAGIGGAMKKDGTNNPALDMLFKVIDRKVNAQMQDLDQLSKVYGMKRDDLEELKSRDKSKLEMYNMLAAAEGAKADRAIQATISQTQDPIIKARAQVASAQVQSFVADKTAEATQHAIDFDQREKQQRESNATARYGIAVADRHNRADELIAMLNRGDAGTAASAKLQFEMNKEVSTRGLKDLKTNTPLYTKAGVDKVQRAAKLEQDAAKIDPWSSDVKERQSQLLQQAAQLRADANTNDVALARDAPDAVAVSKVYSATSGMANTVDRINALASKTGPAWFSKNENQGKLDSLWTGMGLDIKNITEAGAYDKGLQTLIDNYIGPAPTNGWKQSSLIAAVKQKFQMDPEVALAKLNEVMTDLKQKAAARIRGASVNLDRGDNPDELFRAPAVPLTETPEAKAAAAFEGTTPDERAQEIENRGFLSDAVHTIGRTFTDYGTSNADVAREARSTNQSKKFPGLDKSQEAGTQLLLDQYLGGGLQDPKAQLAGQKLIGTVLDNAEKRPVFASALAQTLQDRAPGLYNEVRKQIPPGTKLDAMLSQSEQKKAGAQMEADLNKLATTAVVDQTSFNELSRRAAGTNPNAQERTAARALLDNVTRVRANQAFGASYGRPFGKPE